MEQIERTRRYLDRMRIIYAGAPYEKNRDYYADDVLSFFIHCFHIRDWIITLNKAITQEDIDAFINSHPELRICADLCNGSNHCKLTRKKRTDRQPHIIGKQFVSDGINDVFHTTKGKFAIISNQRVYDALELAEACMKLWDDFVLQMKEPDNRLLSPLQNS